MPLIRSTAKKILFCILPLLFITSCSAKNDADAEPLTTDAPEAEESAPDISGIATEQEETVITWGYRNEPYPELYLVESPDTNLPDDSEVIEYLGNHFGVTFKRVEIPNLSDRPLGDWELMLSLPDIFAADGDAQKAFATGRFRSIPREMIEKHAPNYANLLNNDPYMWEMNQVPDSNGEYVGLNFQYDTRTDALRHYSVYRLDWLERAGLFADKKMTAMSERIYFSEEAFGINDFITALNAFKDADRGQSLFLPMGINITRANNVDYTVSHEIPNLAGMWGLNGTSVNDNGKANMYYATNGYREFLSFLSGLYEQQILRITGVTEYFLTGGVISFGDNVYDREADYSGYWNEPLANMSDLFKISRFARLEKESYASFLIVPPEIGPTGNQFASAWNTSPFGYFANRNLFMVSKEVSDEKLAKILEVLDACSFDERISVVAKYGFEGTNFEWSGEPYNSNVQMLEDAPSFNRGMNLFRTWITGIPANKPAYELNNVDLFRPMYEHSVSGQGMAMVLKPYKENFYGEFGEEISAWEAEYKDRLINITTDYFFNAVEGKTDISGTWDAYLAELNANGLPEWLSIVEKFPVNE